MNYIYLVENIGIIKENNIINFIFIGTEEEANNYTYYTGENKVEGYNEYKATKLCESNISNETGFLIIQRKVD